MGYTITDYERLNIPYALKAVRKHLRGKNSISAGDLSDAFGKDAGNVLDSLYRRGHPRLINKGAGKDTRRYSMGPPDLSERVLGLGPHYWPASAGRKIP